MDKTPVDCLRLLLDQAVQSASDVSSPNLRTIPLSLKQMSRKVSAFGESHANKLILSQLRESSRPLAISRIGHTNKITFSKTKKRFFLKGSISEIDNDTAAASQ